MLSRDSTIQRLRPDLPLDLSLINSSEEHFQNEVLRPIIKAQHDVLIHLISSQRHFKAQVKREEVFEHYLGSVRQFVAGQDALRNQIIGAIVGMMTLGEFEIYSSFSKEMNKRIIQIVTQRFADTVWGTPEAK